MSRETQPEPSRIPVALRLASGTVHLWQVHFEQCRSAELIKRYRALLSPDEAVRHADLLLPAHQHAFLVSRALVRSVLSRYVGVPAGDLAFTADLHGKPRLCPSLCLATPCDFNLSHSGTMAILAITVGSSVGVDVETLARDVQIEQLSRQFSTTEAQELRSCTGSVRARRFWEMWTLKEAYLKATGRGLTVPLSSFSFGLQGPGSIDIHAAPGWNDCPQNWWFSQWEPAPGHLASLCVQRDRAARPPRLHVRHICPLCSETNITHSLQLVRHSS